MMSHNNTPLAVRMRPRRLDEFKGQEHILGKGKLLYRAIKSKRIGSLMLWGPAGSGKTSLGLIVAGELDAEFEYLNAAFSSVSDLKKVIAKAKDNLTRCGRRSLIFIDEIHRFNKLQQESLVPDTESANIILVGATIYNPYYSLIPSLISRSIVANFKPLSKSNIKDILKAALIDKERGLGEFNVRITNKALDYLITNSNGDARTALMALEIGTLSTETGKGKDVLFDLEVARQSCQKDTFYDKKGGYHYDTISAFIKSIRGSDVDSAL
ncbi:MAG: AAA family ATPase, partial [Candidatus Omnitrophica bacterium]|nr:AAA family ATPase [Candidatus Omnitrophota bacterium]MBD3269758.1 AAA family ATPase [Candidatus Omnitrophota bacterium]